MTTFSGEKEFGFVQKLTLIYWLVVFLSMVAAVASESILPLVIPTGLLLGAFTLTQLDKVFLLLFFTLPLSTELQITDTLGTDFPSEPLMWVLFAVWILMLSHRNSARSSVIFYHPLTWIIGMHLAWIFITTFYSQNHFISIKFLLAKFWYVGVFYFLAHYLIQNRADLNRVLKVVFGALLFTAVVIFFRHAVEGGLTFASINFVVDPFYRNKVNYSSLIALFLPLLWYLKEDSRPGSGNRKFIKLSILFLLVALYFGYTRAAMIAVLAATLTPLILKYSLIKPILVAGVLAAGGLTYHMFSGETYLDHAPNYDRTIMHYEFDNLLEATVQFEDISTMERFYRWIAGYYMVTERPLAGFGPGSFYESYRPYTVRSFQTYVSDNPEQSGIHNYYIMLMIEQGIPGFVFFFAIVVFFLLKANKLYHQIEDDKEKKLLVAITASMIIILLLQLMNDLIEVDKVGTFFWLWLAVLVKLDFGWKR